MSEGLFICTDLDRTLIPNGPQSESSGAREHFSRLAAHPGVTLAYVSGRHRRLVEKAICHYMLPQPDFVVGDVGTSIYHVGREQDWQHQHAWDERIGRDWAGHSHAELKELLRDISSLRLQERSKQNAFKLSYYVPLHYDRKRLSLQIEQRLQSIGAHCNLIWSTDEPEGIGLLDILPAGASKYHAIEALMELHGFDCHNTVFCGDSGNDLEVMTSPIPSVLVANAEPEVKQQALALARQAGHSESLYLALGDFHGLNGNYSGGMLEGIAHYHPQTVAWMGFDDSGEMS